MTRAAGGAARAAAARKADEAVARRAVKFRARQKALHDLITDFHHAQDQAAKIRSEAEVRAARILAEAERRAGAVRDKAAVDAVAFEEKAASAVRAMLALGESRQSAAEITEWTVSQVRDAEREGDGRAALARQDRGQ